MKPVYFIFALIGTNLWALIAIGSLSEATIAAMAYGLGGMVMKILEWKVGN